MSTPGALTLGELRALGAFVRQQELDERVAVLAAEGRIPPRFPLAPATRAPVDTEVDVFDGRRWRRATWVGVDAAGRNFTWREGDVEHTWSLSRDRLAPAGMYSSWVGDPSRAREATLREGFRPVRSHEVMRDATVVDVDDAYVTFKVRSFDPNARWVDHLTEGDYALHVADPRVEVPGVCAWTDTHHAPIAVSHRWLTTGHPDPAGAQYAEFIAACDRLRLHDAQTFLIDWCSLPQRPRSADEEVAFMRELPAFQMHFGRRVMVLNEGAEDYRYRGWCMLELMAASVSGQWVGSDAMSPALADAYRLAQGYTQTERFHRQNIHRSHADAAAFLRDPISVHIHNARIDRRREIVDMFEREMRVSEAGDIPLIVGLLKQLVFGEGPLPAASHD